MTRRGQTIHLVVFLALLASLNRAITGSLLPPTGDAAIWLHGGLLMLIFGIYWMESYFTKPADVVVNGLAVFISTSTLQNPPHAFLWELIRYFSLTCVVIAFGIVWRGSPAIPGYDTSIFKRLAYLLIVRVGSSTTLFSCVFLLALISYFDTNSPATLWMLAFWGLVIVAKNLDLEGLITGLISAYRRRTVDPIGRLSRFSEPNIARFEIFTGHVCPRGTLVAFTGGGLVDDTCVLAVVVAHRSTPTRVEAEAMVIDCDFAEGGLDHRHVVVGVDPHNADIQARLTKTILGRDLDAVVGFAASNSDVSRLRFELKRSVQLEEGYLVTAPSLSGTPILYQVVDGVLCEEAGLDTGRRAFTVGDAQQLGTWDVNRQGFASHSWVVPEHAPVILHSGLPAADKLLKPGIVELGNVPNSLYPVNVNLRDLVLFHSAILGVTGSGKSFLAYWLIEQCADTGIKVICLDLTGDYQRYLHGAVKLTTASKIEQFLDDPDPHIGIIEFSDKPGAEHPIVATNRIAQLTLDWCKKNRAESEVSVPKPKVMLVLEEAHSLIPEWNASPTLQHREKVNATAQLALQARKFGLGFMVITQRTASVTKSILNQCNTIFAFQAYDETGFEFMKNYMGAHYVGVLPNLKKQHGVIVGKASTSDRPTIVRFHDQERLVTTAEAPEYAPPAFTAHVATTGD